MRLQHLTQRGGEIRHIGHPLPPGTEAILPVDEEGFFEAPEPLSGHLRRVLGPNVVEAPITPKRGKVTDGDR